jgi:hypothetical protein
MAPCLTRQTSLLAGQVSVVSSEALVAELARPIPRPTAEVLPVAPRPSRIGPVIGGALVWAARELLPEVLAAWRTSQGGILRRSGRKSVTFGRMTSQPSRVGHRHRWGRA